MGIALFAHLHFKATLAHGKIATIGPPSMEL